MSMEKWYAHTSVTACEAGSSVESMEFWMGDGAHKMCERLWCEVMERD